MIRHGVGLPRPYRGAVAFVLFLVAVTLAPPFGVAEATALEAGPPFVVSVTVTVSGEPEVVLMRPISAAGELPPVAMVARGEGEWGGVLRLTAREDLHLAFEVLQREGTTVISDPSTLVDLGVDPAVFTLASPTTTTDAGASLPTGFGWLAAAVVAVVGSIAAVAVWAGAGRRDRTVDIHEDAVLSSGNAEHSGDPDHSDAG